MNICERYIMFFIILIYPNGAVKGTTKTYGYENHYGLISEQSVSQDKFRSSCGWTSKIVGNQAAKRVRDAMMARGVQSVWMPIHLVDYGGWTWLNGEYQGSHLSSPGWASPAFSCAVLRVKDKILDDVSCSNRYGSFLCEAEGSCLRSLNRTCFSAGNQSFYLYHKEGTWYEALEECERKQMALASFPQKGRLELLQTVNKLTTDWLNIWIGLRRKQFIFLHNSTESLMGFQWATDEPNTLFEDGCTILAKETNFTLKVTNCSEPHHFFCFITPTNGTVLTGIQPSADPFMETKKKPTISESHSNFIIACSSSATAVLVIVFIIFLVQRYKRQKNQERVSENRCREENVALYVNPGGGDRATVKVHSRSSTSTRNVNIPAICTENIDPPPTERFTTHSMPGESKVMVPPKKDEPPTLFGKFAGTVVKLVAGKRVNVPQNDEAGDAVSSKELIVDPLPEQYHAVSVQLNADRKETTTSRKGQENREDYEQAMPLTKSCESNEENLNAAVENTSTPTRRTMCMLQ